MINKKAVFVSFLIGLLAMGAIFGAAFVAAATGDGYPPIVQALADRFNLNPDDVSEVFDEQREAKHDEMLKTQEERLGEAVKAGDLTEKQKDELLKKHEEMRATMEEIKTLPPEEGFEAMKAHKEELKAWAEENDIDPGLLWGGCGKMGGDQHMGRGMGGGMRHGPMGGLRHKAPPADHSLEQDTSIAL